MQEKKGNSAVIPFKFQGFCSKRGGFNGGTEDGAPDPAQSWFFLRPKPPNSGFCGRFRCDLCSAPRWSCSELKKEFSSSWILDKTNSAQRWIKSIPCHHFVIPKLLHSKHTPSQEQGWEFGNKNTPGEAVSKKPQKTPNLMGFEFLFPDRGRISRLF